VKGALDNPNVSP